jgi:hypothetical protein
MAVAAGHDGIDQIVAALDQIGLRLRGAAKRHRERRSEHECADHRNLSPCPNGFCKEHPVLYEEDITALLRY